jgi:hypothetical protein
VKTGSAALAVALAEKDRASRNWQGICLVFTRTCLGVPARYASAIIAWTRVTPSNRHGGTNPPQGVPVFWDVGVHGHVALSAGGGYRWSTDILRKGRWQRRCGVPQPTGVPTAVDLTKLASKYGFRIRV